MSENEKPRWYTLDDEHNPVPTNIDDMDEDIWEADWRQVGDTTIMNQIRVSTVFLVLDHNWGDGPPILFETMIFGSTFDGYQERYETWQQAEVGHAMAVRKVRRTLWRWWPMLLGNLIARPFNKQFYLEKK